MRRLLEEQTQYLRTIQRNAANGTPERAMD
jgi:hypothetical protein